MSSAVQLDLLKGKRQRGIKAPPALERETHIALRDTLDIGTRLTGWWWSSIEHGELRTERTGALLARKGVKPGIFDIMLISPAGVPYFLELKRKTGRLSDAQIAFLDAMEARGVSCKVAWSYEEAIDQLVEWGAVRVSL
jgi:hypothetical protein